MAADVCICSLAVRWNCTAPMREMLKKKREKIDEATKFSYLDKASHWEEQDGQKKSLILCERTWMCLVNLLSIKLDFSV